MIGPSLLYTTTLVPQRLVKKFKWMENLHSVLFVSKWTQADVAWSTRYNVKLVKKEVGLI